MTTAVSALPASLTPDQIQGHLKRRSSLAMGHWDEVWAGGMVNADRGRPLLFLDADGVLHPNTAAPADRLRGWPLLIEVLDAVPGVDVVWSSSWRYQKPWSVLMAGVPERLHERFLGATPAHLYPRGEACPAGTRRLEVESFLQRLGDPERPWVALDDQPLFDGTEVERERVMYCDPRTGLMAGNEGHGYANQAMLIARLRRLVQERSTTLV